MEATYCLFWSQSMCLQSSTWAAWFQGVFSVIAIGVTAGISTWQARAQHRSAMTLFRLTEHEKIKNVALSLSRLADGSAKLAERITHALPTVQALVDVAKGRVFLETGEFASLERTIAAIPIIELPHTLAVEPLKMASLLRQYRENLERGKEASRVHGEIPDLAKCLSVLGELTAAIAHARDEIVRWSNQYIQDNKI